MSLRHVVTIDRVELDHPDAQRLIRMLNEELSAMYPEEGANHFRLDANEVAAGNGGFFIAARDGVALGCGAVRRLDQGTCELKRMFVLPAARSMGVGAALVAQLIDEARALGAHRLLLETGTRQTAALELYTRAGFVRIDAYGEYVHSPLSICMSKGI